MDSLLLRPDGLDYKYAVQISIANCTQSQEKVGNYIDQHFWGNSLRVTADGKLAEISINTDKPWEILEYCDGIGDIVSISIERRVSPLKKIF